MALVNKEASTTDFIKLFLEWTMAIGYVLNTNVFVIRKYVSYCHWGYHIFLWLVNAFNNILI